jgi:hypothetical protein
LAGQAAEERLWVHRHCCHCFLARAPRTEMAGWPSPLQRGRMCVAGAKQREHRSGWRLSGSVGAKPLTLCPQAHSRPSACLMRASRLADAFVTLTYVLGIAVTMRAAEALG